MTDRARLGRRSKRKGKTWEREVATLLRPIFGEHVARGWQARSGRESCDVQGSPFWIECKHMQLVDLRAALRQASADTDGRPPVVIAKDDRKPPGWKVGDPGAAPMVLMRLEDWLALARGRGDGGTP